MEEAIKEAFSGLRQNHGGPFGAVIVQNDKIIARGHNEVISTSDPTAHAEILAIRRASELLQRFDLSDCVIYSTCEPCPMCFSAIHWAKMKKMFYGCTRKDAASIGFDDDFIYDVLKGTNQNKQVDQIQTSRDSCLAPMEEWKNKSDKTPY